MAIKSKDIYIQHCTFIKEIYIIIQLPFKAAYRIQFAFELRHSVVVHALQLRHWVSTSILTAKKICPPPIRFDSLGTEISLYCLALFIGVQSTKISLLKPWISGPKLG